MSLKPRRWTCCCFLETSKLLILKMWLREMVRKHSNCSLHRFYFCEVFFLNCMFVLTLFISTSVGRSRVFVGGAFMALISVAAFAGYFSHRLVQKQKVRTKHKHVVASCALRLTHYLTSFNRNIVRMKGPKASYDSLAVLLKRGWW